MNSVAFNSAVGAVLRKHRKNAGLTQSQLACAVGATVEQVKRYEAGTNKVSVMRLSELAAVLGTSASTLMHEIEAHSSN